MVAATARVMSLLPVSLLFVSPAQALVVMPNLCSSGEVLRHQAKHQHDDQSLQRATRRLIVAPRCSAAGLLVDRDGAGDILSTRILDGGAVTRSEALTGAFAAMMSAAALLPDISRAEGADATADGLGVVDDLLADCPSSPTCVSSQDDRPYPFMEPWAYDGSWEAAMRRLRSYLEFNGAKVVASSPRYLRVEFDAAKAVPASVDDAEFYFTPGDALVQFRCARRNGPTDFGANRRRMDSIRVALKFESIPVLRNRKRTFFFGESPVDSFGPSLGKLDPSVVYGDKDPMSPPFETPSGALRERYGGGGEEADRPSWWGKPLAEAGGFAGWRHAGGVAMS